MLNATVTASYKGQPLDVLARLIERRGQVLKRETVPDSVIATAIEAAKSIRAATRQRKAGKKLKISASGTGVTAVKRSDLVPSWRGETKRVCYRPRGGGKGTGRWGGRDVCRIPPGVDFKDCVVWQVTLAPERTDRWPRQPKTFMLLATSDAAAKEYVEKRFRNIADRTAGAGRGVWGHVMAEVSSRPLAAGAMAAHAAKVASGAFKVEKRSTENSFSVRIEDRLAYAMDAIKGGKGGLDAALGKAANKIAGQINHALHRAGDLSHDFPTPFPELKQRR